MDALRNRFRLGQRVKRTPLAMECRIDWRSPASRLGTVVGFSRDGRYVRVRLDGNKEPSNYHPDFWMTDPPRGR